ncbi:MAG: DUF4838 domain-containing protein, partial [Planctomycetes bacterium]|nr:DUF4838 domain-containing protein [Planctomycetota bacterium]
CDGSALQIGGIARAGAQVANPLTGKVDEIRISSVLRVPPKDAPAAPVAPDGDTRLLMHLDEGRGAPEALSFGPAPEPDPPAMFEEQGTCYAVYDFLERFCGVRWFNPTDFGTDYPSTKTLVVQGAEVRRAPFFRFRQVHPAGLRYDSGTGLWHVDSDGYRRYDEAAYAELHKKWPSAGAYTRAKRRQMDAFLCRMRAGGEASAVNHSFYGYYDRFLKTNPDWFAKGYEGRSPQLCCTHPEVIRQVVQDARDFFDGKPVPSLPGFLAPGSDYFPLEPMDNSRYCQCDRCKPWIRERESYTGWSSGVHSDYIFQFVNEVARQVRQTHPNKWVAILAYHSHTAVPQRVKIEPNVIVHFCFACNRLFYDRLEYENELRLFNEWVTREKGRPLYLWLYYTFPTEIAWHSKGAWHAFPGYFVHTLDRQFKMFHQHGLRGMFHCGYGQEVEAYVTLRLMDDPTLDAEALLDEYFSRLYGAAAKPLKEFYLKVEDAYSTPARYPPEFFVKCHEKGQPGHQTEEIAWGHLGTPKLMDELGKLMASAKDLAKSDLEKARVRLFEKAVWDYLVESRRKYDARAAEREQRKAFEPKREAMRQAAPPKVRVP